VALFTAFGAVSAWHLSGIGTPGWSGLAAGVHGFVLLYAMDRVYDVTRTMGLASHSARMLLTGLLAAAFAAGVTPVWMGVVGLKAVLYLHRKWRGGVPRRPLWAAMRLGVGLAALPLFMLATSQAWVVAALVLLVLGECVDRCEFYLDLTVPTPARQVREDLARMIS